ncbi:hypothetical protein BU26DRAFT_510601 [Trematosphaeria pertusa]|uniref:Uncharacterized protein n=1 Tax=Trematosphaeria pertusa TaxID=390896 RepID=A0A6A6HZP0_9PLEO|nr:uncharacterized protein BU26DRAFT_510601 [Trematosphaeria pertusa]KAF2242810.1 hypothetical protein BU26DRAFT_510601 [Trematosphaeria pertusa]
MTKSSALRLLLAHAFGVDAYFNAAHDVGSVRDFPRAANLYAPRSATNDGKTSSTEPSASLKVYSTFSSSPSTALFTSNANCSSEGVSTVIAASSQQQHITDGVHLLSTATTCLASGSAMSLPFTSEPCPGNTVNITASMERSPTAQTKTSTPCGKCAGPVATAYLCNISKFSNRSMTLSFTHPPGPRQTNYRTMNMGTKDSICSLLGRGVIGYIVWLIVML